MQNPRRPLFLPNLWLAAVIGLCLVLAPLVRAQDSDTDPIVEPDAGTTAAADSANPAQDGPVRLARFTVVEGDVTWRTDPNAAWSQATRNLPLRQGAQLWASDGRAEIQFDDGSVLRLGSGALVTLQTLYSDSQGEFTELTLNEGVIALRLKSDHSIYQVNTPVVSVKSVGATELRVGAGDGVEVAVQRGQAEVEGKQGKTTLQSGDFLDLNDDNAPYDVRSLPGADSFDRWNADRDRELEAMADRPDRSYLPSDIGIVADDLDSYGSWHDDAEYGHVWCPRVTVTDWRPYHYGHWVWVEPFGWTWVADGCDAPWGWAPYHYGTWIHRPFGWAWVPGPVVQYWSPAVVSFCSYGDEIGWVPLAPTEVRYPTFFNLSLGFGGRGWSAFFSIGQAGVYYPSSFGLFVGHPWRSHYINRLNYVSNVTIVNHNTYFANRNFVPLNARLAAGATVASVGAFGGHGAYRPLARGESSFFTHGQFVGAPTNGRPVAGPQVVRPTPLSFTPTRTLVQGNQPSSAVLSRPVFRAPVRPEIARSGVPLRSVNAAASLNRLNAQPSRINNRGWIGANTGDQTANRREVGSPAFNARRTQNTDPNSSLPTPERSTRSGRTFGLDGSNLSPGAQAAMRARESLGMRGSSSSGAGTFSRSDGTRTVSPRSEGARGSQSDNTRSDSGFGRARNGGNNGFNRTPNGSAADDAARARRSLGYGSGRDSGSSASPRSYSGSDSRDYSRSPRYSTPQGQDQGGRYSGSSGSYSPRSYGGGGSSYSRGESGGGRDYSSGRGGFGGGRDSSSGRSGGSSGGGRDSGSRSGNVDRSGGRR